MKFGLTRPCKNCPFRSDVAFYMSRERITEIVESVVNGDKTFACHKTIDYGAWGEAEEYVATENEQHCGGALILLFRGERYHHNAMVQIAERLGLFDPSKLDMTSPVYESPEAMLASEHWD